MDGLIGEQIHPKCIGRKCGTWELCSNANVLKFGCIYYDDEAEEIEIENELKAEREEGDTK